MRYYTILLVVLVLLNCQKKYAPSVKKIDVLYLGPLIKENLSLNPILASTNGIDALKIGTLETNPPYLTVLLKRYGLFDLLNEFGVDFVISNFPIRTEKIFIIPGSMGYAIKNYDGIRFAILNQDKDSLSINDQTRITLIKQRSDILWVMDKNFLKLPPSRIIFFLKTRNMADTSVIPFTKKPDPLRLKELNKFSQKIKKKLARKIYFSGKSLNPYLFEKISRIRGVNIVLYPETLFRGTPPDDSITIQDFIKLINCETRFKKVKMTLKEINELKKTKNLSQWGKIQKDNFVLIPSNKEGQYVFDLFIPNN